MKKNRKNWLIIGLIYISIIVIATFFDQQIAEFFYHPENAFSKFIAEFTYVVACYLILLSVFVLIRLYHQQGRLKTVSKMILLSLGCIITSVIIYLKTSTLFVLPFHVIVYLLFWKYMSTLTPKRIESLERPAKYSLMIIITAIVCVESLKFIMGRVRPRNISQLTPFTPWYIRNGFTYKEFFIKHDEIKSFPSGHSAWSIALITLWLYIKELRFTKGQTKVCALIIATWTITVMLTRLILGAHFLSDVAFGSGIMLLSYYIFTHFYYKRYYGMRSF